jgi:hypothetical protein
MAEVPVVAGVAWYAREDYAALLSIFEDADTLPTTYDEWLAKAEELEGEFKARGYHVVRALIDPKTFPSWCAARGLKLNANARTNFGNEKAREAWEGTSRQ